MKNFETNLTCLQNSVKNFFLSDEMEKELQSKINSIDTEIILIEHLLKSYEAMESALKIVLK